MAGSVLACLCVLAAVPAAAQVQTGSIAGLVTDSSNAVLPGVVVSLSGDKLIGGLQSQTTDSSGAYRFDRLPPGTYRVKFELQGFRSIDRADIVVNASFVATVNAKMEVGSVSETITVTGDSPTVDTKSNVQQTVLTQDILEGVPTGRDPWSAAKLVAGLQVSTYDVGGTQSYQQSSFSAHGSSTADVSFNIDGASVNWPGGGGGSTMLYYDQGMFEEVNYITSAIPAEIMVGGVSINMVTKDAGNRWRGDSRYTFSSGCLTPQEPTPGCLESDNYSSKIASGELPKTFLGNPTKRTYDFNLAGGGALVKDRIWVNGSTRRWLVDKLVSAKNLDGTQAIDDNTLKNYFGKLLASPSANQKFALSYNWDNKIRGHRRDTPPDLVPDIASLVQTNPASSTQAKYTGIRRKLVYESSFSLMKGQTNYLYQDGTPPDAIRAQDSVLNTASYAAQRHEEQPNSRAQFDNVVSYSTPGLGGDHLFKGGVQFARLYFDDRYDVLNNLYLLYQSGRAVQVREYNTPTEAVNIEHVLGLFVQDSWTATKQLTVNLGIRYDHNVGILPAQSSPGNQFVGPKSIQEMRPIEQSKAVWRSGLVFDPMADGKTAVKASYSRYALQVGIDRVLNVNPLQNDFQLCTWTDPNTDGKPQLSEITGCQGFPGLTSHYASATGPKWPYSDEVTAGVERQIVKDTRVGVMYYHRTNRDQIGVRNVAVPSTAYTPVTVTIPNGPGGTVASPAPRTATLYNLNPTYLGVQDNVIDNQPYLDTQYDGVEISVSKRMSHRWQMVGGLAIGKNRGGQNAAGGQSSTADLNDPNNTLYQSGIVGLDAKVGFKMSGSYRLPGDFTVAGSLISNGGGPYVSTYSVSRASVAPAVALTRGSQTVFLSSRGEERLPYVTMADVRVSRSFGFGQGRRIVPQLDIFNIGNAGTAVTITSAVGSSYLAPTQILAPRIMRVGFSMLF